MRYLAIDLGEKRTGIAVGDSGTGIVSPDRVLTVPHGEPLLAAVLEVIGALDPDEIVVGLPLNMDGSEGGPAQSARAFGVKLEAGSGKPVRFQDERLTSFAADQALARSGRTRRQKKQRHDAHAAAQILRDYLER